MYPDLKNTRLNEAKLKIYEDRQAPNPRRVRIFLAEKGIDMRYEQVDFMAAEHKTNDFKHKNPLQELPVLELEDGSHLSETVAICRYFEGLYPDPPLFGLPGDAMDLARTDMWQRRMEFKILAPIATAFRHLHPAMEPFQVPQLTEWGKANTETALSMLDWLDSELENRPYIAGVRFSIADITAMVAIDFARVARIKPLEERNHLSQWYSAVSARDSSKA